MAPDPDWTRPNIKTPPVGQPKYVIYIFIQYVYI